MADAELLKIVFINLFLNSAQAMKGQGQVAVTVASGDGAAGSPSRTPARVPS